MDSKEPRVQLTAAKKKFVDASKSFKAGKQWEVCQDFATRALPIATGMVVFQPEKDNSGRTAVLKNLNELLSAAKAKL